MKNIHDFLAETMGLSAETLVKIILSVGVVILLYIVKIVILRVVWQRTQDVKTRYSWNRSLSLTLPFLGLVLVGAVWVQAFRQFGAFLGLFSAGLAIALKDPLTNLAGWFFIVFRQPIAVGDRVQVGEHAGDVIDIRLFQFTILEINNWVEADQSTGRIVHLPNGKVFTEPQVNYSTGLNHIWNEMKVRLTFESNWEKARNILQEIVNKRAAHTETEAKKAMFEASKKFMIHFTHLTPYVYTSVKEFGVLLTIRYLCNPRRRRSTENEIWLDVLRQFSSHPDIKFAYPTTRFYTSGENVSANIP